MSEELIKRLRTVARDEERAWGDEDEVVILLREAADALSRQERGEAVACIAGLPPTTTHFAAVCVKSYAWGEFQARIYAFKYVAGVLQVYESDSDNEYPRWSPASKAFKTVPQVHPLYAHPTHDAGRVAELEKQLADLRDYHMGHVSGAQRCYDEFMARIAALESRLAESREREVKYSGGLAAIRKMIANGRPNDVLLGCVDGVIAALAAEKEQTK